MLFILWDHICVLVVFCKCVFDMCVFIGSSPQLIVCVNLCWGHPTIVVWLSVRLCVCLCVCFVFIGSSLCFISGHPNMLFIVCFCMLPWDHSRMLCLFVFCSFVCSWGPPHMCFIHGVLSTLLYGVIPTFFMGS